MFNKLRVYLEIKGTVDVVSIAHFFRSKIIFTISYTKYKQYVKATLCPKIVLKTILKL